MLHAGVGWLDTSQGDVGERSGYVLRLLANLPVCCIYFYVGPLIYHMSIWVKRHRVAELFQMLQRASRGG